MTDLPEDFIEEFALVFFTSFKFSQLKDAPTYLLEIESKGKAVNTKNELKKWIQLSDEDKQIWTDKARVWLEDYRTKFPDSFNYVKDNWLKIDWN